MAIRIYKITDNFYRIGQNGIVKDIRVDSNNNYIKPNNEANKLSFEEEKVLNNFKK